MVRLTVVAALLVPLLARAQTTHLDHVEIKVHPVAGAVYMLEGSGGDYTETLYKDLSGKKVGMNVPRH